MLKTTWKTEYKGHVIELENRPRLERLIVDGKEISRSSTLAILLTTTATQLGQVIEQKKLLGLPLNGRSYIDLLRVHSSMCSFRLTSIPRIHSSKRLRVIKHVLQRVVEVR